MAMRHLTDKEIQEYLDGNLSEDRQAFVSRHIQICKTCQLELNRYEAMYAGLRIEPRINLSLVFANQVMQKVKYGATGSKKIRIRDILLSALGLLVSIIMTAYFFDFKSLFQSFTESTNPQLEKMMSLLSNIKELLNSLNIDINSFVFAGIILLLILLVDHFISRHKQKLASIFRMLPTLC